MKISQVIDELTFLQLLHGDILVMMEDIDDLSYDIEHIRFENIEDVRYAVISGIKTHNMSVLD
jgi:hypothetical protein